MMKIDLALETKRLHEKKVKFRMYDTSKQGFIGIIVNPRLLDNEKNIKEAGYSNPEKYNKNYVVYRISEKTLQNILSEYEKKCK